MADRSRFPNLRDRAYQILAEGTGEASDADLIHYLFNAQGAAWRSILDSVLGGDERFIRTPIGWALRSRPTGAPGRSDLSTSDRFAAVVVLATGPKPPRARVVAVGAAIVVDGRIATRTQWLFRPDPPPARLPEDLANAGIAVEEIAAAPTFADAAGELWDSLGTMPIVGLDVALNVAFIQSEARRAGLLMLGNPLVELSPLAAAHVEGRPDLARLAGRLGLPPPRDRSPVGRAVCLGQVAAALLTDGGAMPATSAMRALRRRPLLEPATAAAAPDGPGVYLFRDAQGAVLYAGKARSLRRRLRAYCTSDLERSRHMSGLVAQVEVVDLRPTFCPLDAAVLEARVIASHRPPFNVQRDPGERAVYTRAVAEGGHLRLRWSPGPAEGAVGPIRRRDARAAAAAALVEHPRPAGRTSQARALRAAWAVLIVAHATERLRQAALPARLGADEHGVVWLRDGSIEIGIAAEGWIGSRHPETGEWLNPTIWPEPSAAAAEWGALAHAFPKETAR
ncbi:MAG: hypothetical protein HY331_09675 [Chloroflexi bacterium]|nr:hypothetical protein [Chloroflexota bacterium]